MKTRFVSHLAESRFGRGPGAARRRFRAFSLLEMIGVLAVLAAMAAVLAPMMIKRADEAATRSETQLLQTLADGYKSFINRNQYIPTYTDWAAAVAGELGWETSMVQTNDRRLARAFLLDPAMRVGATTNATLPFAQTINGALRPTSPRVLLLSSLSLPLYLASGVPSTNDFNNLWNGNDGAVPANWPANWQRVPRDLLVQRLYLAPLFKRVIMNNLDGTTGSGFAINTNAYNTANTVKPILTSGVDAYYLGGTVLSLVKSNTVVDVREIIQRDSSFTYEGGKWKSGVDQGTSINGRAIQLCGDVFLNAAINGNAKNGATPMKVTTNFVNYLNSYAAWATNGYPSSGAYLTAVNVAQTTLAATTKDLIWKPVTNAPPPTGGISTWDCIGGMIWWDKNSNGLRDTGEGAINAVRISIVGPGINTSTTTGGNGTYLFKDLLEGAFVITVDPQTLSQTKTPTYDYDGIATPHTATVTLGSMDRKTEVDFGYDK